MLLAEKRKICSSINVLKVKIIIICFGFVIFSHSQHTTTFLATLIIPATLFK